MNKTTSCRHTLQTNSDESRFHKRPDGLERFIPNPRPRETYMVIRRWMNPKTRTCFPGVRDIAERAGIDVSTVRRHLILLARLGVLIVTRRRVGHRSNLSNLYTFPLLNEDFARQQMRGGCSQNARVIQIPKIKEQTTTAREAREEWKPDRETFKPHMGRCRMRFSEALRISARASIVPSSTVLTDEEKLELERLREHFSVGGQAREGSHTEPSGGGGQGSGGPA